MTKPFQHPYPIARTYNKAVAYFCMEFAVDQSLKIYSGGLGYLAGSHLRSAFQLRQNYIGIGMLWKYGYYDQIRHGDQSMGVLFQEKIYNFLEDTGIMLDVKVNSHDVKVKVFYLPPDVFGSAPLFLLSTDIPENDYLARTITHRLYDSNVATKVAQYIVLGVGGVKLLEQIGWEADAYHFNEAHALPGAYALLKKYGSLEEVRKRLVFTTHTPIPAGNEVHDMDMLNHMSFFGDLTKEEIEEYTVTDGSSFNQTLNALYLSRLANGVSQMHGEVARSMWSDNDDIAPIFAITNAQNHLYWSDKDMYAAVQKNDQRGFYRAKDSAKQALFEVVADQCGKHFKTDVCTIVWARRFAPYKRADLITKDVNMFKALVESTDRPVQIIWAGKPYPMDDGAIGTFNHLVALSKDYPNCAVLTGYELKLSRLLKGGSDLWLNTPRITREASGTSGMTAAMNGSVNLSTNDGWIPEFAEHGKNAFIIDEANLELPIHQQDWLDFKDLHRILNEEALPTYYDKAAWWKLVRQSMKDVVPAFGSDRMAHEYYANLYDTSGVELKERKSVVAVGSE